MKREGACRATGAGASLVVATGARLSVPYALTSGPDGRLWLMRGARPASSST